MGKFIDLTGQRFGKLLVVGMSPIPTNIISKYQIFWLCICDCGGDNVVNKKNLINNSVQSCGCHRKEILKSRRGEKRPSISKKYGEAALNSLYASYKGNASKRKLNFDINIDFFTKIVLNNCYYCNIQPLQIKKNKNGYGNFIYNGIDRIDSSLGYTIDNCVPCCGKCNESKNDLSQQEFYSWIDRVYNHIHRLDKGDNLNECK